MRQRTSTFQLVEHGLSVGADLFVDQREGRALGAAAKFDRKEKCGAEANLAKLLASEAAWEAADVCLTTNGGYGFARDYDVERKFRETRLLTVAPVSNNLILAFLGQNVLKMPKSY